MVGKYRHANYGVEDKAEEMRECGVRDAVAGPGTVVVHFGDAAGAFATVVCSGWFYGGAFFTPTGAFL